MREIMNKIGLYFVKIYIHLNKLYCVFDKVSIGKRLKVRGLLFIRNRGIIEIGDNVRINSASWANPIGSGDRTYIQVLSKGKLVIGNGCAISNCAITSASMVLIEDNVMIGSGCKIYDTDFHPIDPIKRINGENQYTNTKPITIGENAFLGSGSTILKGVTIGKNAIIGAGAVVTKNIPSNEIWAGNPAKKIGIVKLQA